MQDNIVNTENYITIPQTVAEADISFGAKVLYGYIVQSKRKNWSLVTNKELAKVMKVSERSIRRWLSELKKENYIIAKDRDIQGVKTRTLYLKFY